MTTQAVDPGPSAPAEESPPLDVRCRPDLVMARTRTSPPRWTVKDPLTLRYFQLGEIEHFLLAQLRGTVTREQLLRRIHEQFYPQRLSHHELGQFLQQLFQQGLLTMDRPGVGAFLQQRVDRRGKGRLPAWLMNPLAIRFPGIDPDWLLTRLVPWTGWMFSLPAVMASVVMMLVALSMVIADWDALSRDLPRVGQLIASGRFVSFAIVLAIAKGLHELGHAIACRREGGECREIGLMLLLFTPCLYCNVSDAWLLPTRWQRLVISGAGIYVDLLLAAFATFVWAMTGPGLVQELAVNLMVIGSVSTLFLNGNPLLRYDGYHLLVDLLDVPNLKPRSQEVVRRWRGWLFGTSNEPNNVQWSWSQLGLGLYGVLSSVYLWGLLMWILVMFYRAAEPVGLGPLVVAMGVIMMASRTSAAVRASRQRRAAKSSNKRSRPVRTVITTVAFLVVLAAILFVPVPRTLRAPGQIAGVQSTPIYVTAPGELSADLAVQPGEWVNEGTPLAELRNREIEQEVIQLEAQVRRQEIRVANLEARRSTEPNAAEVLPTARETLKDLQQRRDQAISEQSRLRIVAPRSGVLVAAEPNLVGGPLSAEGTPLDERNRDAWLETGTLFARLVDREARDAVLFVEQADVASLRVGLPVRVSIPQQAGEVLDGKVTEISRQPLLIVPPTFAARSLIPVRATADGQLRPLKPMHEVRVRLSQPSEELVLSQDVEGAIRLKAEPLATQAWRAIRRTLRPDL